MGSCSAKLCRVPDPVVRAAGQRVAGAGNVRRASELVARGQMKGRPRRGCEWSCPVCGLAALVVGPEAIREHVLACMESVPFAWLVVADTAMGRFAISMTR
jgi:hypothetical protein